MSVCLVVDDSRVVRKVARRIIEDFGFSCEEAEDGQKAYEFCAAKMPDMILLDWNMPVMSGIEFLEKLRASEGGTAPKVIFCTTENDMAHITRAMGAGADEYIMKPFDAEIIGYKLSQLGLIDAIE
ncbi:MAG: two-component system response regulator [Micavibrio aeruginosavorus]|uniref:Two-component system response regulator n=1 Tax=Micavibrio aeruginosavorus TaxID=349221 RepID=A0A2W4ZZF9_9BACT|nr:MAG: two-component system response regulator [Micavibrio aeruginosavorus]